MAEYNVRVICFLVLVAWNTGHSFVLKSMVAPSFLSGNSFAPPPKLNLPNLETTDQRMNALEKKIEDLLRDNDKKELRLEDLKTAIESKSPYMEATDKRLDNLEKKMDTKSPFAEATINRVDDFMEIIRNLSRDNKRKSVRLGNLEKAMTNLSRNNERKEVRLGHLETAIKKKSPYEEATDKRMVNLEKAIGNLSRDNERKSVRLGNLESAMTNLSRNNERKEVRLGHLETAIKKKSPYEEATDKRMDNLEKTVANLKIALDKDCGSPPPVDGTDIVYNSSKLYSTAVYRCKKGLLHVRQDGKEESICQESEVWKPVNIKCVNISRCSQVSGGKVFYTGTEYETLSGQICQRWDKQFPHTHSYKEDRFFTIPDIPQTVSGSGNYCRDPAGSGYLWCYTTTATKRWEKCYVPKC